MNFMEKYTMSIVWSLASECVLTIYGHCTSSQSWSNCFATIRIIAITIRKITPIELNGINSNNTQR